MTRAPTRISANDTRRVGLGLVVGAARHLGTHAGIGGTPMAPPDPVVDDLAAAGIDDALAGATTRIARSGGDTGPSALLDCLRDRFEPAWLIATPIPSEPAGDGPWLFVAGSRERPEPAPDQLEALAAVAAGYLADQGVDQALLTAIEHAHGGITLADARLPDVPLVYVNQTFLDMTGFPRDQVLGRNCRFLQGDDADQPARATVRSAIETGRGCTVELRNYRADGTRFINELAMSPLCDDHGDVSHFIGLQRDVTRERELELQLADERDRTVRIIEASPVGMLVLDDEGRVLSANAAAARLLARPADSLIGADFGIPLDPARTREITIHRPEGEAGVAELSVTSIDWSGDPAWLVMLYDITGRRRAEERIAELAHSDTLTGLANRERLYQRLRTALDDARRSGGVVALLMLDLDRFKQVNDSLGHPFGDRLLIEIARRLRATVRDHDLVARPGGDEFVILLEAVGGADNARVVADKILAGLSAPVVIDGHSIFPGASIGISVHPDDAADTDSLVAHADIAMYACKADGGGRARVFDRSLGLHSHQRLDLEQRLRGALDDDQFVVHYQPQVDLADGRLVGLEALVRWQDPQRGLVGPDEFIPVMESLGLIERLGEHVLDTACRQLAEWASRLPADVILAVNVSARQLRGDALAEHLEACWRRHGVAPARLMLEITESAAATDPGHAARLLDRIRAQGVAIAMDDFGTGHSALGHLRLLPIDVVKIDSSFVADVPGDRASEALIRAIIEMSHGMDKRVLAEGVETEVQARALQAAGCDLAQGFLYAAPRAADAIAERWLDAEPRPGRPAD